MRRALWSMIVITLAGAAANAAEPAWPGVLRGFHLTAKGAEDHAQDEAVRLVTEYLHKLEPPLTEWKPDRQYVMDNLAVGRGIAGPDLETDDKQKFKTWILRLKQPDLRELTRLNEQARDARIRQERLQQSEERLKYSGWILGGVLVVLSALRFRPRK